ncbi:MAG: hypothetical protein ACT4OG_06875 [Alphaproteobacteria bacterium]
MLRICLATLAGSAGIIFSDATFAVTAILDSAADRAGASLRVLRAGDELEIVGDCFALAKASRDVRVVLTIADSGAEMGVRSVLATVQELRASSLYFRVPETPGTSDHVFRVRVYAMTGEEARSCEAGQIRIA